MCDPASFTAFVAHIRLATGPLNVVLQSVKQQADQGRGDQLLIFKDDTGEQLDFDLRGTLDDVLARIEPPAAPKRPGRPKLGVVAREVTLLPRHWEWLGMQPQGISAALRRLVDEARKREPDAERARQLRLALGQVLWSLAGNLPGFEEVTRTLHARRDDDLLELIAAWPTDLQSYVRERLDRAIELER